MKHFLIFLISVTSILFIYSDNTIALAKSNQNELIKQQIKNNRAYYQKSSKTLQAVNKVTELEVYERRVIVKVEANSGFEPDKRLFDKPKDYKEKQNYNLYFIQVRDQVDFESALSQLQKQEEVVYAIPDYKRDVTELPTDIYYEYQQYMEVMTFPNAWSLTNDTSTTIAVLDTGINSAHPDLKGRVLSGYDFYNEDSSPEDNHGHGTIISGVIAANWNEIGIAGVNKTAKILPIKVAEQEKILDSATIKGIYYAIENNVDVINMSFSGVTSNLLLRDTLWEAYQAGITLIAASGNSNHSIAEYPASYPFVISVGSVNEEGLKSSFSNYGNWIDIAAVGENIISTGNTGGYVFASGTSLAAPFVTGLTSQIIATNPLLEPHQVEYLIESSGSQANSDIWNDRIGYGMIKAENTMKNKIIFDDEEVIQVNSSQVIENQISLPMEIDSYDFSVVEDGELTISINNVPSYLDLVGILTKVDSNQVVDVATIDQQGNGESEDFSQDITTGNYNLSIFDYYNHWSDDLYQVDINLPQATASQSVERIYGATRIDTAVEIAQTGWIDGAESVILTTAVNYPDALTGTALAYQLDSPILLTDQGELNQETKAEIIRLKSSKVYILGGETAISSEIKNEISAMGLETKRIAGNTREGTAVEIAKEIEVISNNVPSKAIIVYAKNYPDALAIAPYAAQNGYPILLADTNSLSKETNSYLENISETIVIGGTSVINEEVLKTLPSPTRISGATRYDTMKEIIEQLTIPEDKVIIATGDNFADALTGAPLAAKTGQTLMLVETDQIPIASQSILDKYKFSEFTILGGPTAINDTVLNNLK